MCFFYSTAQGTGLTHGGCRAAGKQDGDAEEGKKKRGGMQIPEEWPWEEAKKLFENPDVTPAEQIDVSDGCFAVPLRGT